MSDTLDHVRAASAALRSAQAEVERMTALRDRTVLEARADHTLRAVADAAGITYARVQQIEQKANRARRG